jgi:hypothetical protein
MTEKHRQRGIIGATTILSAAITLAACGSSTPAAQRTPTKQPTVNVHTVGKQFLAIVDAGNAAVQADKKNPSNRAGFVAISGAFSKTANQLQSLTYPPDARADAATLVSAMQRLSVDAANLAQALNTPATAQVDLAKIQRDESAELVASNNLRYTLGLPPASVPAAS